MRVLLAVLFLLLGPTGATLHAQRLADPAFPAVSDPDVLGAPVAFAAPGHSAGSPILLALGGVAGGVVGTLGGGWAGARITGNDCEDCFLVGLAYGALVGVNTGVPLGVHLANRGRGNLLYTVLASAAIGAAGLGVAELTGEPAILFGVPVLQIAGAVAAERAAARR